MLPTKTDFDGGLVENVDIFIAGFYTTGDLEVKSCRRAVLCVKEEKTSPKKG